VSDKLGRLAFGSAGGKGGKEVEDFIDHYLYPIFSEGRKRE